MFINILQRMPNLMHGRSYSKAEVVALLEAHGIIPTQQRIEIAQVLFARPQHVSAEQVLAMVNEQRPVASKATIYNTLGLFASKGLIREVIVDPSRVFYDPNTSEHHHFYNVDTGTLTDIGAGDLAISKLPSLPEGTTAEGVDVIIRLRQASPPVK
jgi:Fur family transcriptional regulator, iron response regulator